MAWRKIFRLPDFAVTMTTPVRVAGSSVLIRLPNLARAYRELLGMSAAILDSGLDWTIARFIAPKGGDAKGVVREILRDRQDRFAVTRADIAAFTAAQAPRGRHHDPPRDPSQPLLTRALVGRTLLVSGLLGAGTWWLFEWDLANGAALPEARIAALNLFVAVEASYLFSWRSLTHSAWRIGLVTNRWLIVVVVTQAVAQAAITYLLAMRTVFQIQKASLDAVACLRIAGLAGGISLAVEGEEYLRARK